MLVELLGLCFDLFCIAFPMVMIGWTAVVVGLGVLRHPEAQPPGFGLIAPVVRLLSSRTTQPDRGAVACGLFFLGVGYFTAIGFLFYRFFYPLAWCVVAAFFLVNLAWLKGLRAATRP